MLTGKKPKTSLCLPWMRFKQIAAGLPRHRKKRPVCYFYTAANIRAASSIATPQHTESQIDHVFIDGWNIRTYRHEHLSRNCHRLGSLPGDGQEALKSMSTTYGIGAPHGIVSNG